MPRKTATVTRAHVYGTPRFDLRVTYRGEVIRWREGSADVWAIVQHLSPSPDFDPVKLCREYAKRQGFTHIRFCGDWDRYTKPKGGKLR